MAGKVKPEAGAVVEAKQAAPVLKGKRQAVVPEVKPEEEETGVHGSQDGGAVAVDGRGLLKCSHCTYSTATQSNLSRHTAIHTGAKPYECEICGFRSAQKGHMGWHMKTHSGNKPFECTLCNVKFTRKGNLVRHMGVHGSAKAPKREPLETSSAQASGIRNLAKRVRVYTDSKPHRCEFCTYSSTRRRDVAKHTRTHTGHKPYECDFCNYRASDSSSMATHMRSHS